MRPPPALALAALCLLALPAAVVAAYFGLVPAAIPRGSPKPTCLRLLRLLQGQLLPPSGPGCGSISNSDLSFGSTQPHFAVGCRAPSSVSGLPGSDPHRTFQRPTLWSPSLPFFSPLPVRDLIPSLRPISEPCLSSRTLHASRTLTPFARERRVPACPGVAPAL